MRTYVGTDGKIHFVNSAGADTALNFSSGNSSERTLQLDVNLADYAKYPMAQVVIKDKNSGKTLCSFSPWWGQDTSGYNTHSSGRNTSVQSTTFVV